MDGGHRSDLPGFFGRISLVDTYCVNPNVALAVP